MDFPDRIRLPTLTLIQRRPRLLNLLERFLEEEQRLITVYAPSGYGKSVILADYALTTDLPVCWCSLAPEDRDPTSFLTLLTYSIIDRFREIKPEPLINLVKRGDTQLSIHRITEALATVGPHVIIIDDYHKAVSAGMTLALNRLLEQLPDDSTIIVAARGDMTLATGQILELLIAERATGLSEEELRFTPDEIQRVMRKRFGQRIDLETATAISGATDGNVAQILLAGHMQSAIVSQMVLSLKDRLGEDRLVIYGYLADEVFDKQSPALQHFMLHTAILPDMTPDLCNVLLDIDDAQECLDELVRRDLFVTQIGAGFKYHDLFAEFLRAKLAENQIEHRAVTYRAAQLLACRERYEEAMTLYLSIKAWPEVAGMLENQGRFYYDTGRALTLQDWLEQIPKAELEAYPQLLLLHGQILNNDLGNPQAAIKLYQQAEAQFSQQGDLGSVAETKIKQSISLRMMGQVKESLSLAKQAFQLTQDLSYDAQFTAYIVRNRGLAEATAGNLAAALTDLREAMKLYEKLDDSYRVGLCHNELGICLAQQGNLNAGIHHFKQAVRLFEVLGNANDLANTLNSLGTSLCLGGHYQEALQYFRECQDVATQVGAVRRVAYALAGIGDAYFGLQDYEQAIDSYTHATNLARDLGIRVLENYTQVKQGDCYFARQDYQQALRLANQTAEIATEIGLRFELGLARTLQAKIAVQKTEYEASFSLFASAINNFTQNDVLEQAKVRLWWSYALLLSWREAKALEQLQTAMTLIQQWEELLASLATTVQETRRLLLHFLHQPITALGTRDQIYTLLFYNNQPIDLSEQDLQVFAFGPPRLLVAGSPKQFVQRGGPSKAPEFLLYLILHSKQGGSRWSDVSVELWPDEPTDKVSDLFHQQLKRLRRSTFNNCDDYLIRQHDYYQINLDWLSWCDALIFDTLFEQASQAEGEEALSLRLELIALYQGEFLAGFELSEWGMTCRTNYEIRFLEAVRMASQQLLATGESQEAINVIGRGLELDYFREDLHRSALQAYAQMGMYDHLTDYYAELRQTFKREFGCPPDVETQTIYQQLLTQR